VIEWRPDFGDLYDGDWPHASEYGVGLRLDGLPKSKDGFIRLLMEYSCHPAAGERIYNRIEANGFDLLTVMARLPFIILADRLSIVGVKLSVIEPDLNWMKRFDDTTPYEAYTESST